MNYDNYIRRQKRNGTKNNNFVGIRVPGFYAADLDDRQQNAGNHPDICSIFLYPLRPDLD